LNTTFERSYVVHMPADGLRTNHNVAYIDRVEKWAALYTTKSREELLELNASGSHRDESVGRGWAHAGDCNVGLPAR